MDKQESRAKSSGVDEDAAFIILSQTYKIDLRNDTNFSMTTTRREVRQTAQKGYNVDGTVN
eukprot:CAMPEP_0178995802 /NCGR_PEP_ID=MMETSP0795-20121207/8010_1 /TAXON_ID=88552 /ORGANISM="Amoebophrya sp., Strain Ameob2" /LENGTH=60 /DNA_ID=CAMNT_0020688111 /DNA_START=795 /DNA_END=977 /DNA_ORIENTATION=+